MSHGHEEFWRSWFGLYSREVGSPYRGFCPSSEEFLSFLKRNNVPNSPSFMSVQGYSDRNQPSVLERLFFDFDCKEDPEKAIAEAKDFAEKIGRFYGAKAFLVFSGSKGCHVYVWLHALEFLPKQAVLVKESYRHLQLKLLKGLRYETVDPQVIGDLARLSRVPYTLHDKSGRMCEPLAPVQDLEVYRKNGLSDQLLRTTLQESRLALEAQEKKTKLTTPFRGAKGTRKQIRLLIEKAQRGEQLEHKERLAIVCELLATGKNDDEICQVFALQEDFGDGRITRYMVEHARRRGYRPFRLATLEANK